MKFQLIVRVCLIFYTYDSANFKKHVGNNHHEKNATRYCAGPAYYRMCSTDVYCSKQTGSSSTKGNHHPSFLRFWNWAEEENCRLQPKFVAAQKVLLKQKRQTFVNGFARFYYFRHLYSAGSACIAHNNYELPIDVDSSALHCSLIYFWVPSGCFCIVIGLSLRVRK